MEFYITPALQEYMDRQQKDTIVVELVQVTSGDFDLSELHIQLADAKRTRFFLTKKNYRSIPTQWGTVLLPRYPLELADRVTFGLKKILFFRSVTHDGIKL